MFSKKLGALKRYRGHMEGLKGLGKILKSLQKHYGHAEEPSQDEQSYDCEDLKSKQCQNINHATRIIES